MKIFVNARFLTQPLSGVQRYGIECSRQIKKLYHEATFVCPENILHHDIAEELEAQIVGKRTGHVWEQSELPLFLAKKGKPPLLNLANTAPFFYNNNYITIHDLAFYHHPEWNSKLFSTWYNILIPRLAYKCRHIFTVSKTMKDEITRCYHIPGPKISVTYNGIGQTMLSDKMADTGKKEKIILSVGSFNTRKNHQNLIAAFLQSDIKSTFQLVIIGDKNKVFKESNIDETTLKNGNIKIYERFTEQELINMYKKAEAVVSLSLYEGFGIPLLEGLFFGCKVVCSDIPVYRELYNTCASFCSPTDVKSIAATINHIPQTSSPVNNDEIQSLFETYNYKRSAMTIIEKMTLKTD